MIAEAVLEKPFFQELLLLCLRPIVCRRCFQRCFLGNI